MGATVTSPHPVVSAQRHVLEDEPVLRERPLRLGTVLQDTARFRDDRWPLRPALLQHQQHALTLNFSVIPARYRLVAKELCYTMLSGIVPPGESRPAISTVHSVLRALEPFVTWLDARAPATGRPARPALADLTGTDLQAYERHLTTVLRNAYSRDNRRGAVRFLWRYRTMLTSDRLPFDPCHVEGWGEPRRHVAAENATDRIPEAVHGPMLAWSLRFIDDFAPDILAADQQWRIHREWRQRGRSRINHGASQALRHLLDEHLNHERPLPGYHGKVNINFLAATLACAHTTVDRHRDEIEAVAAVVGVSAYTYFDIPITGRLADQPWVEGIPNNPRADNGLAALARMLQAAAYITLAFLSGMRDNEIKHLRRGCLRVERDEAGQPYRWKVTSLAFKGENDPAGVEATWVVGAPAARAVEILQRLQPPAVDLLFAPLGHGPGNKKNDPDVKPAITYSATNIQLNHLTRWINNTCARHGRADGIPAVNGRNWRLNTRQFRRTLAWFIARRPGGAIAGAIAYRHQAIQMFEGYAGTSDSGFRAEVESEQALARGEQLLAMIDSHEHHNLAGPAAKEAARRLDEFGEQAQFQGTVITDERRLRRLMNREDPAIYPGQYITCVHKHATALCRQRRDSRAQLRPDPGSCQPFACRNVALTPDNIVNLRQQTEHIDHELESRPLLPPLLQHQLRTRREQIVRFLARHSPEQP